MISKLVNWAYELRDRKPKLKRVMARSYVAVRWLNQFRHRTRKVVNGVTYELDLAEDIDSTIYFKGAFEPDTVAVFKALVRPGDFVIDVGANIGWHSLLLATLVRPNGHVVAFEPISWARRKLARNLALNPEITNVSVEKVAVSSDSAPRREVSFRASWRVFGSNPGTFTDEVEVVTIDDYVTRSGVPRVDVIKIDVDGFEHRVIRGATKTLQRWTPALVMEFGVCTLASVGDRLEALVSDLNSMGYLIFDEKTRHEFSSYQQIERSIPKDLTINVVCLHGQDARLSEWVTSASRSS